MLCETWEVHDRYRVVDRLLSRANSAVDRLDDPSNEERIEGTSKLICAVLSTSSVEHHSNALLVECSGLVAKHGLQIGPADTQESLDDLKSFWVLHFGDILTLVTFSPFKDEEDRQNKFVVTFYLQALVEVQTINSSLSLIRFLLGFGMYLDLLNS